MKVLGIDPGLRVTGYAVLFLRGAKASDGAELVEAGVVRTPGTAAGIGLRLAKLHDALAEVIDEHEPDAIAIEKLFAHYKHPTTAILMAHARGVVCLLAGLRRIPITSISTTHVKKAVTGQGHAKKEQVQHMIQQMLGLKTLPDPPDVADAMAIAMAYAFGRVSSLTRPSGPRHVVPSL